MLQAQGIRAVQRLDDRFPQLASVVGSWHQVDHYFLSSHFQHSGGLSLLAEVIVVVPVIVVSFLEGLQCLVEEIADRDP